MHFWEKLPPVVRRLWAAKTAKRIYLDHASATPMFDAAVRAMRPYFQQNFANASAIHTEGVHAKEALVDAREQIARLLQIQSEHVVFTSGGTESNNVAILGYVRTLHEAGRPYSDMEVVTTTIEHPATLEACAEIERWGVGIKYLPVNEWGHVEVARVSEVVSTNTVLLSVAHINSEIGVVQPTHAIARAVRKLAKEHEYTEVPLLHVDAAQSPLWYKCDVSRLGADMVSFDVAKCGGPKGVGVLAFAKKRTITHGMLYGGGQEYGLRPGTEPVALIVGAQAALREAQTGCEERSATVRAVRDDTLALLKRELPECLVNGPEDDTRAPYNINISLPGYDTEYLALVLDNQGVAVSTKSACSSVDSDASNVVYQISRNTARAQSTLRCTLREEVSTSDMQRVVRMIQDHIELMRPYSSRTTT